MSAPVVHVAVPDESVKVLVPPLQLTALPCFSVMTKVSVPVGVPSEDGVPFTVALSVAVPPLLVGDVTWSLTADVPSWTFSW